MKTVLALFAMLLAIPCLGIEIATPPPFIQVGEDLDLEVTGLESVDRKDITVIYWPKDGVSRCSGVDAWNNGQVIEFRAVKGGEYLLHVCTVVDGKHEHDEVVITVGPQVPPLPDRYLDTVLVVEEAGGDRTPYLGVIRDQEINKWLNTHSQQMLLKDVNMKDPVNEGVPKDLVPWILKVEGKTLPYLFFISEDGSLVWEGNVPKSGKALLELIEDYTEVEDE